jgi:acetyltransferase-like isoleucine patch superfamily enzyme
VIGVGTYLGIGATLIDRLRIGSGCVVGAGALVTRDLPDRVQAVGAPARAVKREIERF